MKKENFTPGAATGAATGAAEGADLCKAFGGGAYLVNDEKKKKN